MNRAQLTFVTGDAWLFNMPGQSCVKCWRVGSKRPENSFLFIKKYIEFPQSRITELIIDTVLSKRSTTMVYTYYNLVISHKIWVFNYICCKNIRHPISSPFCTKIYSKKTNYYFCCCCCCHYCYYNYISALQTGLNRVNDLQRLTFTENRLLSGWNLVMFIL